MTRENVEIVRAGYDAVQQKEYESGLELLDREIVWDMSGLGMPDLAKVYRGHEGIREFFVAWLAAWDTIEFNTLGMEDHGDHVLVEVEQRNLGRGSGVSVAFHYFQAFTVRDGKVKLSYGAQTRAKALEAVGLTE